MSNLSDNVSGAWINSTRYFGHTPDKIPVTLFVEGDSDIPFWEKAVAPYQIKYNISVKTNQAAAQNQGNGKSFLLTMQGLCKNKVVAVDADFDLIIDGYSAYTDMVREGEFVINTTYYSLENILLKVDAYANLLRTFSVSTYKWFINHLAEIETKEEAQPSISFGTMLTECKVQKCAGINDFSEYEELCINRICDTNEAKVSIRNKYEQLLNSMSYNPENVWELMRGHNLWDMIVKPVMKRKINKDISSQLHEGKNQGMDVEKNEIMHSLGIYTSVDEFIDVKFYNDVSSVLIPEQTKLKLDAIFC